MRTALLVVILSLSGGLAVEAQTPPAEVNISETGLHRAWAKRSTFAAIGVDVYKVRKQDEPFYRYFATADVANNGTRTITQINWAFVLFDPVAEKELLRLSTRSEKKIKPGQRRGLVSGNRFGLDALWWLRHDAEAFVTITRIEYDDGTVWDAGQVVRVEDDSAETKKEPILNER